MSQNQENPDNDYEKWQQEHDQRRREFYDCPQASSYEYQNNSSFTETPPRESFSSHSIFGNTESSQSTFGSFESSQKSFETHRYAFTNTPMYDLNEQHQHACLNVAQDLYDYTVNKYYGSQSPNQQDNGMNIQNSPPTNEYTEYFNINTNEKNSSQESKF